MAVRHASRTAPEAATIICSDCPGLQVPSGADPPPDYSVTDHCSQPALSKLSAGACARVPLFAQDRPIGVLNLAKARSAAFSVGELLFLQTIASQVSIALENACLIRETQTRLQETATLLESATPSIPPWISRRLLDASRERSVAPLRRHRWSLSSGRFHWGVVSIRWVPPSQGSPAYILRDQTSPERKPISGRRLGSEVRRLRW